MELTDMHRLRQKNGLRTTRGVEIQVQGMMFAFEICQLRGESLAIWKDAVWYEVWIDAEAEESSWHDLESGTIAILHGDRLMKQAIQGSMKAIVARLLETTNETIYLSHEFCVRINAVQDPGTMYKITNWIPITDDQVCCIS